MSIDDRTSRLNLPLPNQDNFLEEDVQRLRDALSELDAKVATVDGTGKIPTEQLPAIAITDTFPVSSEAEMLALEAQPGDVAIRGDVKKSFILMTAPATNVNNWKELINDALEQLANPSSGDALIAVKQPYTDAVPRTQHDKNAELVSVKDFGAGAGADDNAAVASADAAVAARGGGVLKWTYGAYNYTGIKPSYGVTWDMDGPNIPREKLGGSPGAEFQTAKFTYMPGPHPTKQLHAHHIRAISKGSNAIGAPYADYALGLTIEKENWSESFGTPSAGEINGLMIFTRNGCLTSDPVKTGGAAILADIGQTKGSGYTQFAEIINSVFAKGTFGLTKQTNLQLLGIDEKSGDSWGAIFNSNVGSQSGCMRIVGTDAAPWNYILQSWKNSAHVFYISDVGKLRWRVNGISMSLEQDAATGAMVVRNENGVAVEWTAPGGNAALRAVNVQTGTTYTINVAEILGDLNKTVVVANSSPVTVTLPNNAPVGFHCEIIQRDPGQVTFVAATGATLQNVDGHTKTKGMHAVVRLRVRGNGSGQAAIWVLDGSTAA